MAETGKTTKPRVGKKAETFSAEERAAMQEARRERKKGGKADGEADLLAKVAEMDGLDKELAGGIHAIVREVAPQLQPKTWYGMPAYANADGKIVCFFTPAGKFKVRYASFGFNEAALLDDGDMWPTSFALTRLGEGEKKRIAELVKRSVG